MGDIVSLVKTGVIAVREHNTKTNPDLFFLGDQIFSNAVNNLVHSHFSHV